MIHSFLKRTGFLQLDLIVVCATKLYVLGKNVAFSTQSVSVFPVLRSTLNNSLKRFNRTYGRKNTSKTLSPPVDHSTRLASTRSLGSRSIALKLFFCEYKFNGLCYLFKTISIKIMLYNIGRKIVINDFIYIGTYK